MSEQVTHGAEVKIGASRPRVLELGTPPPPPEDSALGQAAAAQSAILTPAPYWTPDKAERLLARSFASLAKLYGDSMKVDKVELELAGPAVSAVLNDWMPAPTSMSQGDKFANLLYLGFVLGMIALFRLPDILAAHGWEPGWAKNRQRGQSTPRLRAVDGWADESVGRGAAPSAAAVVARDEIREAPASSMDRLQRDVFSAQAFGDGRLPGNRGGEQ